jgi:hypothetical protein
MSDRNECTPGDYANFAAVKARRDADNALLANTRAAVEAAAVNGLVNIQMARGPVIITDSSPIYTGEAHPPTVNGRFVTPGPVVQADINTAVNSIVRGDATLVV